MKLTLWKTLTLVNLAVQMPMGLAQAVASCAPFSPYQQVTSNRVGSEPEDLVEVSKKTGLKSYNLAFVSDGGVCKPMWSSGRTISSGWAQGLTDSMRAAGIEYRVSFGGAGSTDISKNCSLSQLINTYQQIINIYQPTGLDFDIENNNVNSSKIMSALKTIVVNNPNVKISFTLPVMPSGLGAFGKNVVNLAKNAGLNFVVNIMTMDYGPSYTGDMGQYAIQAATNTFNYLKTLYPQSTSNDLWQKIAITPMIGVNDIPAEIFTLKNTDMLRDFAQKNNVAWLSMWSLGRDRPCSNRTANSYCSGVNAQTKIYEFTGHFLSCLPKIDCLPPANIQSSVSADKKSITIRWDAPQNTKPILNYQVNDYRDALLWKGTETEYTDSTLAGQPGNYAYYLHSICASGLSIGVKHVVSIS